MKLIFCALSVILIPTWAQAKPFHVVLVDKATHQLHLAQYDPGKIQIQKSYHATLGKALGDKEVEKDLKTPEGIYFFKAKLVQPNIKKKFGVMAITTDYPNAIDKKQGKTGYDIMLHSTDDISRLKRDYDSEGCVVIDNPEIKEVAECVRQAITPFLIYAELKPEYLEPEKDLELKAAFENWIKAWEGKNIEGYIGSYASDFKYNGMNLSQYRAYKDGLNKKYNSISVGPENIRYFRHPKYSVVIFTQNYESTLKKGAAGFKSAGTKILYFMKQNEKYKIAVEDYTTQRE